MVHADIKPANLVFRYNSNPLLITQKTKTSGWCAIDFGCAINSGTTTTLMGTPRYIAPEVNESRYYSAAADIYAFGLILKELMGDQYPLATKNEDNTHFSQQEIISDILQEKKFHVALKKIIDYMAQPNKINRPELETLKSVYIHLITTLSKPLIQWEVGKYYSDLSAELEEKEKKAQTSTIQERSFLSLCMEQDGLPSAHNSSAFFSSKTEAHCSRYSSKSNTFSLQN